MRRFYWLLGASIFWLSWAVACGGAQLVPKCVTPSDCEAGARCIKGACVGNPKPPKPRQEPVVDAGGGNDSGSADTGAPDNGPVDSGPVDNGPVDNGPVDNGPVDNGPVDNSPACAPSLVSLAPSSAEEGQKLSLMVKGSGFVSGVYLTFNNQKLTTTRKSDTELEATLALGQLPPGKYDVSVVCPDGKASKALPFTVKPMQGCKPVKSTRQIAARDFDILFVVDNSGSMADNMQALQGNLKLFFDRLDESKYDYQIGVTTMDVSGRKAPAGCLVGTTKIITNKTPNPMAELQKNLTLGSSGSAREQGLEAAKQALSTRLNEASCNKGFLRKDSTVQVIFVTDEKDQSTSTVADYIKFFQGLRANPLKVRTSHILGELAKPCKPNLKNDFPRYSQVDQSIGGIFLGFCGLSATSVGSMASLGPAVESAFPLKAFPKAGSLKVAVDGKPIVEDRKKGFYYDAAANAVVFSFRKPDTSPALPAPKSTLVIEYLVNADVRENLQQRKNSKIDFLFVVDNSCSMGDEQVAIANQAPTFMARLKQLSIDYHIGVTTTDTTGRPDPSGCFRGTPKVLHPGLGLASMTLFQQAIQAGTRGSAQERGLAAAYDALSVRLTETSCNKGFLRKDAALALIFLTDEDDASQKTETAYISFFQGLKSGVDTFAHALVGPAPNGCRVGSGSGGHGSRYLSVSKAMGGVQQSICQLQGALTAVVDHSVGTTLRFKLKQAPEPKSIRVEVNNKPVTSGWTYDAANQEIVFTQATAPKIGEYVDVFYRLAGQCVP